MRCRQTMHNTGGITKHKPLLLTFAHFDTPSATTQDELATLSGPNKRDPSRQGSTGSRRLHLPYLRTCLRIVRIGPVPLQAGLERTPHRAGSPDHARYVAARAQRLSLGDHPG
ncbi:hypothetical protein JDV02_010450 [Purpureocillium takamizusanense]|uniref:Uncharacterized protein n=1 Tax=Purpureocillium takamizusanense TaxID=2060973 RepID=A0A9Q8VHA2_9HYPO|nr:uncharacterized protein JDV02_010450 [Purpureocillium takamizusanense]UNI24724.1 hypothetical protein JDV02_010450 [Purpureocillium takamizusanense]